MRDPAQAHPRRVDRVRGPSLRGRAGQAAPYDLPSRARRGELFRGRQDVRRLPIAGWRGINESDMILMPDPTTAFLDPSQRASHPGASIATCRAFHATALHPLSAGVARRAEAYLKASGIADEAFFGPRAGVLRLRWGAL